MDIPISVNIIVEGKFLVLLHLAASKDTHANMVSDSPFGNIAVGCAAVIQKATNTSALGGIDILSNLEQETSVH